MYGNYVIYSCDSYIQQDLSTCQIEHLLHFAGRHNELHVQDYIYIFIVQGFVAEYRFVHVAAEPRSGDGPHHDTKFIVLIATSAALIITIIGNIGSMS